MTTTHGNGHGGTGGNGGATPPTTPPGSPPGGTAFHKAAPEGHAKTVSAVLGEIVWLMSQSPIHKQMFISDLEWFAMAPALLEQFRLYYDDTRPIGVVLWARVSEEIEQRLAAGTTRLRPQDWKSGERLWVVEIIAPFGGAEQMLEDLKAKVFPTAELRVLTLQDGRREVRVV